MFTQLEKQFTCGHSRRALIWTSLALSLHPQMLTAAPGDEIVGEQQIDILGDPDLEGSFWDPAFWRNLTTPLESPVLPTTANDTYFRRKNFNGTPLAEPTSGMTLKTAKALGFTPPNPSPVLGYMYFCDNDIRFDGTPDVPSDPLGTLKIGDPALLELVNASSINFDRTVVHTANIRITGRSGIQVTGDVSTAGHAHNFHDTSVVPELLYTTFAERTGAGPLSVILAREDASVSLSLFNYDFDLHPSDLNTGNAPVIRAESGGQISLIETTLDSPSGVIFDSDASTAHSSILLGSVTSSGVVTGADPQWIFQATGNGGVPADPTISVTGSCFFSDLAGTFASATESGQIAFLDAVRFVNPNNNFRVLANTGGSVEFSSLVTTDLSADGSVSLDWLAYTGGGLIDGGMPVGGYFHLNGADHSVSVSSGGEIRMIPNLGIDAGATLSLEATGADSVLAFPNSFNVDAWDDHNPVTPPGSYGSYTLTADEGATIRGGKLLDFGGFFYPDIRSLTFTGHADPSSVTLNNATAAYASLSLGDQVTVSIGGTTGSTLQQVDWNLGSSSSLTMDGGSWQPEALETLFYRQSLTVGGETGGSSATLTGATLYQVDASIGGGMVEPGPGEPAPPPFTVCSLLVDGGSTWTGALNAATQFTGKATVTITGAGTTAGLRYANLGAIAQPIFDYGMGAPTFSGEFFVSIGGEAELFIQEGARLSIGSYANAFGTWDSPDDFNPAVMMCNDSDIHIDSTSAAFIGDVADASGLDYVNGALVVGPGGYLLGTGTIYGAPVVGPALVNDGGTISPGFSPGTLSVDGDFLMEAGTLIMEIKNGDPGGYDVIAADEITISSGTIRIKPTFDYVPGSAFSVDLFQSLGLTIDPSVVFEFDPAFDGATFDPLTGILSGGSTPEDILAEVLPPSGNTVELPSLTRNPGGSSVYSFRRLDSSLNTRSLTVQWSTDLDFWNDIAIPSESAGSILIEDNGSEPDLISVTLPDPAAAEKFFVRLMVE